MMKVLKTLIASGLVIVISTESYASGLNKLLKFIDQSGGMSNYNAPAIIQDQQGGFMTGGSLQIRGARPKHYNRHMFSYRVLTLTPVEDRVISGLEG